MVTLWRLVARFWKAVSFTRNKHASRQRIYLLPASVGPKVEMLPVFTSPGVMWGTNEFIYVRRIPGTREVHAVHALRGAFTLLPVDFMTLTQHFTLTPNHPAYFHFSRELTCSCTDIKASPKTSAGAKHNISHLAPTTSSFCPGSNVNCEKSTAFFALNSRNQGPISKQKK